MFSTDMILREYDDRIKAYKEKIKELETDRSILIGCWFSATKKLKELGYRPKMSASGLDVEEWMFEQVE